jgi:hypothetical protein
MTPNPPFKKNLLSVSLAEVLKNSEPAPGEQTVKWECTREDWFNGQRIVDRIMDLAVAHGFKIDKGILFMDLMNAHCNATPLDLWQLLASGGDDFTHDVLGIGLHIERATGRMLDGWKPIFAKKLQ